MYTRLLIVLLFLSPLTAAETPADNASTQAWREFTQQLEKAGTEILETYPQPHALDRAEGVRYLLDQLQSSIQKELIKQPGQIPLLRIGATTINKWGLDGADAKYQGASIDSKGSYRLHGQLGSARLFALQLVSFGEKYGAYAALTGDQLQADKDGNFELMISPKKPADWQGAWLALNLEASDIIMREYFSDWENEQPGTYYLQRTDAVTPADTLSLNQATAMLNQTVATFSSRAPQWSGLMQQARTNLVNRVHMQKAREQGLATNHYGSGWFKVADDEALIIELESPKALLWSVQLGNVWWESIDYINHTASFNDSQAVKSKDGKYRFVLSLNDPGIANWLDPDGHNEGMLMFRLQEAEQLVSPELKVIPFAKLADHLPPNTPRVDAKQRQAGIEKRRAHAARRWAP